jgi:hypothetical protein
MYASTRAFDNLIMNFSTTYENKSYCDVFHVLQMLWGGGLAFMLKDLRMMVENILFKFD